MGSTVFNVGSKRREFFEKRFTGKDTLERLPASKYFDFYFEPEISSIVDQCTVYCATLVYKYYDY